MLIKKNIVFVYIEINGKIERLTVSKKSNKWIAYNDGGHALFKSDTYKGLIAILSEYENLNK